MFEYDNNVKLAVEILDKYDISEELLDGHGMEVGEMQDMLLNKFKDSKDLANAIGELSEDELCTYLNKKYDIEVTEETRYFLWNRKYRYKH